MKSTEIRTVQSIADLRKAVNAMRQKQQTIGLVPTMGALHAGHISLVEQSVSQCDATVVSIFVNPTQFAAGEDLSEYPRPVENDLALLAEAGVDLVFMPTNEDVYPEGSTTSLIPPAVSKKLEGESRPTHFAGVATVVLKLLNMTQPDVAYFGQKDYQQLTIVRSMIKQLNLPVKLVMCPIKREADGLAMSSRNVRLKPAIRERATILSETLKKAKAKINKQDPAEIQKEAMTALSIQDFKPEYFRIVDGITLLPVEDANKSEEIVACTAVWAGDVRLIDNMILK